jgi:glycosyltransferase involved in cell wall biosynthesis
VRVLHVIKGLGAGGAERLLVSLTAARGADVEVEVAWVLPWKDALVSELEQAGGRAHVLAGRRGLADPRWPLRLRKLVQDRRIDVVHLHSPAVAAVARPVLRTLRPRPVIVSTEHNLWRSFGPVTRVLNGLTLPLGDAALAVSDEVRASVWSRWRGGVDVVVQGIPLAAIRARRDERSSARARLGLADTDVFVVNVANFREKKDHATLLRAARLVLDHAGLRFASVGQGPLEAEIHALHAQLGLGERFRFLGFQADPIGVLVAADVFVLTSRHEGLPISLLEAMALGVAPVATRVGGIPEVVADGDQGVLVAPGDPEAVAAALVRLADDAAERVRLGAAAARRAEDFDIARTQAELEARYADLLRAS